MAILERKIDISLPSLLSSSMPDMIQYKATFLEEKEKMVKLSRGTLSCVQQKTCQENQHLPGESASITTKNARKRGGGAQELGRVEAVCGRGIGKQWKLMWL